MRAIGYRFLRNRVACCGARRNEPFRLLIIGRAAATFRLVRASVPTIYTVEANRQASPVSMVHYKITYFNVRNLAEASRMVLTYAGEPFEDVRLTMDEWAAVKPSKLALSYRLHLSL